MAAAIRTLLDQRLLEDDGGKRHRQGRTNDEQRAGESEAGDKEHGTVNTFGEHEATADVSSLGKEGWARVAKLEFSNQELTRRATQAEELLEAAREDGVRHQKEAMRMTQALREAEERVAMAMEELTSFCMEGRSFQDKARAERERHSMKVEDRYAHYEALWIECKHIAVAKGVAAQLQEKTGLLEVAKQLEAEVEERAKQVKDRFGDPAIAVLKTMGFDCVGASGG